MPRKLRSVCCVAIAAGKRKIVGRGKEQKEEKSRKRKKAERGKAQTVESVVVWMRGGADDAQQERQ